MRRFSVPFLAGLAILSAPYGASATDEDQVGLSRAAQKAKAKHNDDAEKRKLLKLSQTLNAAQNEKNKNVTDSPSTKKKAALKATVGKYKGATERVDKEREKRLKILEQDRIKAQKKEVQLKEVGDIKNFENAYSASLDQLYGLEDAIEGTTDASKAKAQLEGLIKSYQAVCTQFGKDKPAQEITDQLSEYHGFIVELIANDFWKTQFGASGVQEFLASLGENSWNKK